MNNATAVNFNFNDLLRTASKYNDQRTMGVSGVDAGDSIEAEVANLIEYNRVKIGSTLRPAFTEWANADLMTMDMFDNLSVVSVNYIDDRGNHEVKNQLFVHTLWAITMTALATDRDNYMSSNILARSILNWVEGDKPQREDSSLLALTAEQANEWAMTLIRSLQGKGVLSTDIVKRSEAVIDAKGNQVMKGGEQQFFTGRFYALTLEFKMYLEGLTKSLQDAAVMTCRPMTHVPQPWTAPNKGVGPHCGLKLIKAKFQPHSVAKPVLNAVNKLQEVRFVISEVIAQAARDMRACDNANTREMVDLFKDKELTNEEFDKYAMLSEMGGEEVSFPITMDGRGRMYYRGGILTPQGTDLCKAAFQFARSVPLGKTGLKAVYIQTANAFGQDKISIRDRVEWVTRNLAVIMRCTSHWNVRKNFKGADVFQALAAASELRKIHEWTKAGNSAQTFKSNLVCHQDGTCNGLQHSAAITKDRATAIAVNCTESTAFDIPNDVYDLVSQAAIKASEGDVAVLLAKYGRDLTKGPVMIGSYGAGSDTIIQNVINFLKKKSNEGSDENGAEVGAAVVEAMTLVAGGVSDLTTSIKDAVKARLVEMQADAEGDMIKVNPNFKWKTADGFIASTEYRLEELFRVREGKHAIRVRGQGKAQIDLVKTVYSMSPNLVHSIDAAHARMVVNHCDHDLVTVHDSIGSHAGTYFATAKAIRQEFVNVHNYDALGNLCENLKQSRPQFDGDYEVAEALKSTYIFS